MGKITMRISLKSGVVFNVNCTEITLTMHSLMNGLGDVVEYDIKGITENWPIYVDFEQVAAIVWTRSEEGAEGAEDEQDVAIF